MQLHKYLDAHKTINFFTDTYNKQTFQGFKKSSHHNANCHVQIKL